MRKTGPSWETIPAVNKKNIQRIWLTIAIKKECFFQTLRESNEVPPFGRIPDLGERRGCRIRQG